VVNIKNPLKPVKKYGKNILMFLLIVYFLVTSVYIVHETVHLFQAKFDYSEVCFLGRNGDAFGWVRSSNFPDGNLESTASLTDGIYMVISSILMGIFVGKLFTKDNTTNN
jgi:uncharacterized membrane-anchored protein YitT (DUF2179 family)